MNSKISLKLFLMCASFFSIFNSNAQDWANLKRYQDENAALATPAKNENRVVFMGNSITQGWKETHPDFFTVNPFIDRGISGQTTPQMLLRFRQDVIALQPKVVVILAGTNDIAGNTGPSTLEMIMDNLSSMAEVAQANKIKVILCSVLPAYDYPWKKGMEPNIKIPKLNEMIKAYCEKKGFLYLDFFSAMANDQNGMIAEYTLDGVHCTSKGYDVMESLVKPAIQEVLKKK
ncbi:MAG: SGNH/GDSL hydrolase family protein [Paludibacter sp.]